MRTIILSIILFLFISVLLFVLVSDVNAKDPSYDFEHTTAICNDNLCQDYLITCKNSEAISMKPVGGLVIFSDDWKDLREKKSYC